MKHITVTTSQTTWAGFETHTARCLTCDWKRDRLASATYAERHADDHSEHHNHAA